jgi:hypothetical protein
MKLFAISLSLFSYIALLGGHSLADELFSSAKLLDFPDEGYLLRGTGEPWINGVPPDWMQAQYKQIIQESKSIKKMISFWTQVIKLSDKIDGIFVRIEGSVTCLTYPSCRVDFYELDPGGPRLLGIVYADTISADVTEYVVGSNGEKYPLIVTNLSSARYLKPESWRWSGNSYQPVLN